MEAFGKQIAQDRVEVVAAQFADAFAADLLEDAVMDAQNRDVQRAAAKIVDEHRLILLGIEAITDGGRGWLVDERQDLHAGRTGTELGGVAGEALGVGGDGDDSLGKGFAERLFRVALEHAKKA